eukprot:8295262-Alexandrium_andersonii.AAC.1
MVDCVSELLGMLSHRAEGCPRHWRLPPQPPQTASLALQLRAALASCARCGRCEHQNLQQVRSATS